ncbi:pyridoxamine 5'-phosphate oxidase family protein [uncultured Sphingomonas sp.]|uniref:pyridoxamine 5'-phosphate oxidase family protein n=1 Tax=uncultured Sphingomonas sp. TaxID=158754 RepID=UPI00374A9494
MPKSLTDLAEIMRDIDFTMLSTKTADGGIAARPMSNNRDVDYDGDSYFFALDSTHTVQEIQADPNVGLTLHGNKGLLGKPPIFIAAEGKAEIIHDKAAFEAHWVKDLERWFEQGTDTPGLVLIKVHADRIHYWDGEDQGEITFA